MKLLTPTEAIQFALTLNPRHAKFFLGIWSVGNQDAYQEQIDEWMKERVK